MNAIATRTSTRCPTGIDVGRTAGALVATYGENAAMIARKWAEVAVRGGDAARAGLARHCRRGRTPDAWRQAVPLGVIGEH